MNDPVEKIQDRIIEVDSSLEELWNEVDTILYNEEFERL